MSFWLYYVDIFNGFQWAKGCVPIRARCYWCSGSFFLNQNLNLSLIITVYLRSLFCCCSIRFSRNIAHIQTRISWEAYTNRVEEEEEEKSGSHSMRLSVQYIQIADKYAQISTMIQYMFLFSMLPVHLQRPESIRRAPFINSRFIDGNVDQNFCNDFQYDFANH